MASIEKYRSYDFENSKEWKEHLNHMEEKPADEKMELHKRKWYKTHVDQYFDIKFDENPIRDESLHEEKKVEEPPSPPKKAKEEPKKVKEEPKPEKEIPAETTKPAAAEEPPKKQVSIVKEVIYYIEALLKIAYFITYFVLFNWCARIAAVICICGILRIGGVPKFNKEYAIKIMKNEFMQNLWFIASFAMFERTHLFYLPLALHFWIGICEFLNMKFPTLSKKYASVSHVIQATREYRHIFIREKSKIEFYMMPYLVLTSILGWTSFFILVFYFQYMRAKYAISQHSQDAIAEIDYWIRLMTNRSWMPRIILSGLDKIRDLCRKYFVIQKP